MKTPRELLLERHASAAARLPARGEDLAAYTRSGCAIAESMPLSALVQSFWTQAIWPWRRVWTGIAVGWVVVLAFGLSGSDSSVAASVQGDRANPEVQAVLEQQEQLLSQLLGRETSSHASPPQNGPRSALVCPYVLAASRQSAADSESVRG